MGATEASRPKAGIVGAGIAGLAAAIALRKAGWDVEVFEKSHMRNEVGAAITLMPIATAALDSWGFDFAKAKGVENHRITILHAGSLDTISHDQYTNVKEEYGHEALTFHRVDLHHGMIELAVASNNKKHSKGNIIDIHKGSEVSTIDCEAGILVLATGQMIQKDLLVIADGAHTHLFSQLMRQPDPVRYIGRSIYRILLDQSMVDASPAAVEFLTSHPNSLPGFCCAVDPVDNVFMITYPCRSSTMLNVAIVYDTKILPSADQEPDRSWQTPSSISQVLETVHNFHPDLKAMLQLAANDDIKIHHGMHRPPLNSFVRGRAVFVGDAAHLMLPTHAAGASMAIESAVVLEVLMRDVASGCSSFPSTPTASPPPSAQANGLTPDSGLSPIRPPCSTSSSTRDLIVGKVNEVSQSKLGSELELPPPTVTVTDTASAASTVTNGVSSTNSPAPSVRSSMISRSLTLFDSLRVPRCTAFQILSNNGFMSQARPEVVEQIRRHGFDGPLPGPTAGPWSAEFREWYFGYNARAAAEKTLAELSPQ